MTELLLWGVGWSIGGLFLFFLWAAINHEEITKKTIAPWKKVAAVIVSGPVVWILAALS